MKTVLALLLLSGLAPQGAALGSTPRGEVVELMGDYCTPCRGMSPIVLRLQREGLPIRQINVETQASEAQKYGFSVIPTFLVVVDGKVLHRQTGAMPEQDLRNLVAMIPKAAPETVSPKPSSPNVRVELGEPTPMPRPAAGQGTIAEKEIKTADASESSILPKAFRRQPKPEPEYRGQSNDLGSTGERSGEAALAASVRVNLLLNGKMLQGSGTIIDSHVGRTIVITSGAPFKTSPAGSKIEVEVPNLKSEGSGRRFVAKLISSDLRADIALVEFPTDQPLPTAAISVATPNVGDRAVSIGGSVGGTITREQVRVTGINRYEGPDTLDCTGVPLPGRSGGGLFNAAGELVGICVSVGEDPVTKAPAGGMYCGLKPIHELLRGHNLAALIDKPRTPAGGNEFASLAETDLGTARPMPADIAMTPSASPPSGYDPTQGATAMLPAAAQPMTASNVEPMPVVGDDDLEVILYVRSKKSPEAPTRVIHIHKASPTLRSLIDGPADMTTSNIGGRPQPNRSTTGIAPGRVIVPPLAAN
jgi:S1-C subfamily serine protease